MESFLNNFNSFKNILIILFIFLKNYIKYLFHQNSLRRLKDICHELQEVNVIFIKIIQSISINSFLFNEKEQNYLLNYTDQVPYSKKDVNIELLNSLKEENIELIDSNPINSGLIALIYKGIFKEKEVAIKVLRKNIDKELESALSDLNLISYFLSVIPFIRNYKLDTFLLSNVNIIINQLNFKEEVKNIKSWENFSKKVDYLKIPEVYEEFTNKYENVIVMEFIHGKLLNQLNNDEKKKHCDFLILTSYVATFFYGLIHGDIHPGNILFLENKICLLDFGIASKMHKEVQNSIYEYYKELYITQDFKKAAFKSLKLLEPQEIINKFSNSELNNLTEKIGNLIDMYIITNPNIQEWYNECNKLYYPLGLQFNKDFNNIILGAVSGLSLNCSLLNTDSIAEYTNYSKHIIINLLKEAEFSLD